MGGACFEFIVSQLELKLEAGTLCALLEGGPQESFDPLKGRVSGTQGQAGIFLPKEGSITSLCDTKRLQTARQARDTSV